MKRHRVWLLGLLMVFGETGVGLAAGDVARGEKIAKNVCSICHAIGTIGVSPNPNSPPFRTLSQRYPLTDLEEAFGEGIVVGGGLHMPIFTFRPSQIEDLIAYLKHVQTR